MGRKVNFFLHPYDCVEFDRLLKSFEDLVMVAHFHYNDKISVLSDSLMSDVRKEGRRVYLIRQDDFAKIQLKEFPQFGYSLIEDGGLPIIHFDRCIFELGKIHRGRLYFETASVETEYWRAKPGGFIDWQTRY
jgi:hypothetical protein